MFLNIFSDTRKLDLDRDADLLKNVLPTEAGKLQNLGRLQSTKVQRRLVRCPANEGERKYIPRAEFDFFFYIDGIHLVARLIQELDTNDCDFPVPRGLSKYRVYVSTNYHFEVWPIFVREVIRLGRWVRCNKNGTEGASHWSNKFAYDSEGHKCSAKTRHPWARFICKYTRPKETTKSYIST